MYKKLLLPLVLGVFFIGACAQEEQGLSNEDKEFNYFRCVEGILAKPSIYSSKEAMETRARNKCLYHLD